MAYRFPGKSTTFDGQSITRIVQCTAKSGGKKHEIIVGN